MKTLIDTYRNGKHFEVRVYSNGRFSVIVDGKAISHHASRENAYSEFFKLTK